MNETIEVPVDPNANVVWMGEFLFKRLRKEEETRDNVLAVAMKVNKKSDPREDQFAGPLMAKADRLNKICEKTKAHLQFIFRGGFGPQSHVPRQFHMQPQIPPVTINVGNIETAPDKT